MQNTRSVNKDIFLLIKLLFCQNWEFQYYSNNRTNSFTHSGRLFIRPSLTSDQFGTNFLSSGHLNIEGGAPADRLHNTQIFSFLSINYHRKKLIIINIKIKIIPGGLFFLYLK